VQRFLQMDLHERGPEALFARAGPCCFQAGSHRVLPPIPSGEFAEQGRDSLGCGAFSSSRGACSRIGFPLARKVRKGINRPFVLGFRERLQPPPGPLGRARKPHLFFTMPFALVAGNAPATGRQLWAWTIQIEVCLPQGVFRPHGRDSKTPVPPRWGKLRCFTQGRFLTQNSRGTVLKGATSRTRGVGSATTKRRAGDRQQCKGKGLIFMGAFPLGRPWRRAGRCV